MNNEEEKIEFQLKYSTSFKKDLNRDIQTTSKT